MKISKAILDEIVDEVYEGVINLLDDLDCPLDFGTGAEDGDGNTMEDLMKDKIRQSIKGCLS